MLMFNIFCYLQLLMKEVIARKVRKVGVTHDIVEMSSSHGSRLDNDKRASAEADPQRNLGFSMRLGV